MDRKKALIQRFWEKVVWTSRSLENPSVPLNSPQAVDYFTHKGSAGQIVNQDTALKVSAVFRAVDILSETFASLPWNVFKLTEQGRLIDKTHPYYDLLHNSPSSYMTSFTFRSVMMKHILLWGFVVAEKKYDKKGRVVNLVLWHPDDTEVALDEEKGELGYKNTRLNGPAKLQKDVIHILGYTLDGVHGLSVIQQYASTSLGIGLARQDFTSEMYENGGAVDAVLMTDQKLDPVQANGLTDSFKNKKGLATLHSGLKYQPITMPLKDAQLLESTSITVADVSRWFGVPLSLLSSMEGSQYNNMEHQNINFLTYKLRPILVNVEQEVDKKLFSWEIDKGFSNEFNIDGILRADSKSRGELYKSLFGVASISPDEIRAKENMISTPNGGKTYIQEQYIPTDMIEDIHKAKIEKNKSQSGDTNEG